MGRTATAAAAVFNLMALVGALLVALDAGAAGGLVGAVLLLIGGVGTLTLSGVSFVASRRADRAYDEERARSGGRR